MIRDVMLSLSQKDKLLSPLTALTLVTLVQSLRFEVVRGCAWKIKLFDVFELYLMSTA